MDGSLEQKLQESEEEWAEIEKQKAQREKKDRKIISQYCAGYNRADMVQILELLEKHGGMPKHDKDIISEFKNNYPETLTTKLIHNFEDVKDIYSEYLESGGENDD